MAISVPSIPEIAHKHDFLRKGFFCITMYGMTGSGKSWLLRDIIPIISDNIKTIIIATRVEDVDVHIAVRNYIESKNGKDRSEDRPYFSKIVYDPDELIGLLKLLKDEGRVSREGNQGLLIFDDFNVGRPHDKYITSIIHAVSKYRNKGWNFILIVQQPQMLPTAVRTNVTARILFHSEQPETYENFIKPLKTRASDLQVLDFLCRYIEFKRFSYLMSRNDPFEISIGNGLELKKIMTNTDVSIPTVKQLQQEMGVRNRAELDVESAKAQRRAGNTSAVVKKKVGGGFFSDSSSEEEESEEEQDESSDEYF